MNNNNFRRRQLVWAATFFALVAQLAACTPAPPPGGGGITETCQFAGGQATSGLTMNCVLTGPIPNTRIDPFVPNNPACGINSWIVFGQTITTPITATYGQNGDDSNARVRLGVALGPGTHAGNLAKDNPADGCATTVGPSFAITTTYSGTYVGLIDKAQTPMCVFQSRLVLTAFTQNIAVGMPVDVSGVTRGAVEQALLRRLDLEMAGTVNRLLQPASVPLPAAATNRSGRCANDYQPFTGT